MSKWQRIFSLVFVLALAANFIPMPQAASAAASQAELAPQGQVHPARGGPGTTFSFAIRGFTPATTIAYWATTPAGTILGDPTYTVETNQAGEASWDWTAPRTATFGVWTMVVQQVNRVRNTTLLAFEIAPGEGPPSPGGDENVGVEPFSGTYTTTFTFYALGFTPEEEVSFWFNAPDGSIIGDMKNYKTLADAEGMAEWTWTPTANAPAGFWTAVVRGHLSGQERTITFEIRQG